MKLFSSFSNRRIFVGLLAVTAIVGLVQTVPAADEKPTIPIIVKDTTSAFWQIVLAGARKAGKELNVNVPELGAQSESDINGQISILENAVSGKPVAIVISPTQFKALGQPIDEAAKKTIIIGIDSAADSKAFTSFLQTDNVQGGRVGRRARCRDRCEIWQARGRRCADYVDSRRRFSGPAREGLQGGDRGQVSRLETRRRQGC